MNEHRTPAYAVYAPHREHRRKKKDYTLNVDWKGLLPINGVVIVIEDDPTLRALMVEILAEIGAKSLAFSSADDALAHLLETHGKCPLVITDHSLPGQIQGAEFIEMVRGKWPSIAAILTSGYLLDPGMIPPGSIYLYKPWSMDKFIISVAAVLQPGSPVTKPVRT